MTTYALPPLEPQLRRNAKRTRAVFASCPDDSITDEERSVRLRLAVKINDEFRQFKELPPALLSQQGAIGPARPKETRKMITANGDAETSRMIAKIDNTPVAQPSTFSSTKLSHALALHKTTRTIKPTYHPPWKLVRVISGHLGWVRSVAVEPGNKWFATGAGDRVIKIWDLASGELKLSLTGHISTTKWSNAGIWSRIKSYGTIMVISRAFMQWIYIQRWTFYGHNAIINTLSVNAEGVFFSGGDNGTLTFWDYNTGTPFQNLDDVPQPGSLEAEAGVFCSTFDMTGTRLITGGADKTIKVYAEQSR
ncbi:WD40 repeat-like protein [Lentinula edodes]|uniref:Pre-mRNA-splicing factor PRP46 n=1 Tax=Lentinula edodes TaxID=5353 RepID=A0A1Q3E038_LENED|nr:WD40 repeat-like protein [Lentinula edodes]